MAASDLGLGGKQFGYGSFGFVLLCVIVPGCICGCSTIDPQSWIQPRDYLYDKDLSAVYDQTRIKKSLTLDVLPRIERSKDELISQSDNVVVSLGQSEDGYKTWFTMVAFHEHELSVVRKYFYVANERVGGRVRRGLRLDCEMLLDKEGLERIRTAKEQRQIALLKEMRSKLDKDVAELGGDADVPGQENKKLDVSVLLIRQILDTVVRDLDRSPVLATRIGDPDGIDFDHISFGKGKIQLLADGNIALLKLRLGALLPTFYELGEVGAGGEPPAGGK
ncbi:MAG: hypothetical protein JW720_05835 [Sedimentisphaerales bacterium]|nr:hypothetical protein [Sedimentisphaerales bacterium]